MNTDDVQLHCLCPQCQNRFPEPVARLKQADSLTCPSCQYSFTEPELAAIKGILPEFDKGVEDLSRALGNIKGLKPR